MDHDKIASGVFDRQRLQGDAGLVIAEDEHPIGFGRIVRGGWTKAKPQWPMTNRIWSSVTPCLRAESRIRIASVALHYCRTVYHDHGASVSAETSGF